MPAQANRIKARKASTTRPHLINQLNQGLFLDHTLILVSAPAGFGKTTLVSDWVQNLQKDDTNQDSSIAGQITWLSLDEADNDPTQFLRYFIAALNQIETIYTPIGNGALGMLQSPQPPMPRTIMTSLINEIAAITEKVILVLDDYHLISAQPIHDALSFLLENMPPQMHLIIATREDPVLPLSRLRVRNQLTELRAADLRFTVAEAANFLNQAMGLDLATEDIAVLETRTEGWIAGLQLAALSLQGRTHTSRLIQSFTGSNRLVLDYLIEEVLLQQSEEVQDFLLKTAVLDQLTAPLCNVLTGHDNGQATLELLERNNLFIIPLDDDRLWYRYHHLFADLLRQRLKQIQTEQLPRLHTKASEWYQQNSLMDEAIEHMLAAEDFERAAHLLEGEVDAIWGRDEHIKLRYWLEKLPVALIDATPHLGIIYAWSLFSTGQQEEAERRLNAAEDTLGLCVDDFADNFETRQEKINDSDKLRYLGRIAVTRAFLACAAAGNIYTLIIANLKLAVTLTIGQFTTDYRNLPAAAPVGERKQYVTDNFGWLFVCDLGGSTC